MSIHTSSQDIIIKLECWMDFGVCNTLAKLTKKIWPCFLASWDRNSVSLGPWVQPAGGRAPWLHLLTHRVVGNRTWKIFITCIPYMYPAHIPYIPQKPYIPKIPTSPNRPRGGHWVALKEQGAHNQLLFSVMPVKVWKTKCSINSWLHSWKC